MNIKKRYYFKGFYGESGHISVYSDDSARLVINIGGKCSHAKFYKNERGARIALGKYSDSYTFYDARGNKI